MQRAVLLLAILALVSLAGTAQISFIVLNPMRWQPGHLPDGWQIKVNRGAPVISTSKDGDVSYLDLKSRDSSYGLERALDVDPRDVPYLTWRWQVRELPAGGDFRHSRSDDQAAQVLVAFADKRILTYIWDTTAPKGTFASASSIPFVHIHALVCRSGGAELNRWLNESHNVAVDYQRAYGKPAPRVKGIRLQINSQHTSTSAESCFGDVAFRSTPQ